MTAEAAIEFEALETQAASLMMGFTAAGYERVAPAFIQPAALFLDLIGETIRARTYVFTDPNGEELCLRPDLTVPVARVFLEREPSLKSAKFCYNGPAFRIQEGKPDPLRPREFRQAGIEYYGSPKQAADVDVFALTLNAVRSAGLKGFTVRIGHIGLFSALLASMAMPQRWRERLLRAFWRPATFVSSMKAMSSPEIHVAGSHPAPIATSEQDLLSHLDAGRIAFIGVRRPSEVVQRLRDKAADANEPPLAKSAIRLIENYLAVRGDIGSAMKEVRKLLNSADASLKRIVDEAEALFHNLRAASDGAPMYFDADFGRHFEYYTGMVFQIEIDGAGVAGQIAGGGRYDGLISALSGGARDVPAVGSAIHTERLLMAAQR